MKCAIYARVSLDEQANDKRYQEPENQLEPLRKWANDLSFEIYKEYIDRGSGANPARDRFREMINEAMLRKFNVILVWKLDRFSRESMSIVLGRIQKLRARGIGVMSFTESWLDTRTENPMSDLVLAIMSWASAEERRKISERTKLGIQRRKNLGVYKGGRPQGSKDKKPRRLRQQRGPLV